MFFRMIYDEKLAAASYLIGCQKSGEAIVIDPLRDVDRYVAMASKEGLRIVAVAETHIHADFLSGSREMAERLGAKVHVSDEGDADWKYQWLDKKSGGGSYSHQLLKDGEVFRVGNIEFKAIHTPGHTPEHMCFMVTDRGGGADQPMGIATGDFIFVGDLGRPDLLETAAGLSGKADPSAKRLYQTVRKFDSLPDWLQVWPAHGAGSPCGKALGAVPQSTLGYERRFNPAIRAATSEQDFVSFILEGQPEPPLYFARMKRDNKLGPKILGELPRPAKLSVKDLLSMNARKVALIDTRSWEAFRTGHVDGALFHPVNQSFPIDVGSMVGEDEPVYLIIDPGRVEEAVRDLVRIGLDNVKGYFEPSAVDAFERAGGQLVAVEEMSPREAAALAESSNAFLLDVRRATEFREGHMTGARNIAHTRLMARMDELPRNRSILVNCRSGARSARACALLQKNGFQVVNLAGGFIAWERENGLAVR